MRVQRGFSARLRVSVSAVPDANPQAGRPKFAPTRPHGGYNRDSGMIRSPVMDPGMAISLTCSCGARLEIDDKFAGQAIPCPDCQQPLNTAAATPVPPDRPV